MPSGPIVGKSPNLVVYDGISIIEDITYHTQQHFHGRCLLGRGRHNVKIFYICVHVLDTFSRVRTTRVVSRMAKRVRIVIGRVKKVIKMVNNHRMVTIPRTVTIRSQDLVSYLEYFK